jgi:uncharacterized protein
MTDANISANATPPDSLPVPAPPDSPLVRSIRSIFRGPSGIRAGWRLLIFVAILVALAIGLNSSLQHIPVIAAWAKSQPAGAITAVFQIFGEGLAVASLFVAAGIMSLIEKRSFSAYGLPVGEAFGKRFWTGVPLGFLSLTALLVVIAALHGFSLAGTEDHGPDIVKYGVLFGIGFILVGIFEEFSFRGYMQATLASGIGFWPAAVVLSILFGAIHLGNPGEAKIGAFMAGSFGLVAALALRRTGSLWFPIGMHAAWDWAETYFYGVPDSGLLARGRLFNSSLHGPNWLTGGSVGPEGSYFAFVILALMAVVIHFAYPAKEQSA